MKRFLIIDDSTTSRLYLKKCLTLIMPSEQLEFIEAKDGEDALAKLVQNQFDLIISDVNMPVMNGDTFIKNVKKNPAYSNIADLPVLFVTSLANEAKSQELIKEGAIGVIKKPINVQHLSDLIKPMFENSKSTNEENEWG